MSILLAEFNYLFFVVNLVASPDSWKLADAVTGCSVTDIIIFVSSVTLTILFQGTPPSARYIPIFALFSPLFILQGAGVLFALARLVEKVVLLLRNGPVSPNYLTASSKVRDCFAFLHRGSRYHPISNMRCFLYVVILLVSFAVFESYISFSP